METKRKIGSTLFGVATALSLVAGLAVGASTPAQAANNGSKACAQPQTISAAQQAEIYGKLANKTNSQLANELLCFTTSGSNAKPGAELKVAITPVYTGTSINSSNVRWVDSNNRNVASTRLASDGKGGWKSSLKLTESMSGKKVKPVLEDIEASLKLQEEIVTPELWDNICLEDEEVLEKSDCFIAPEEREVEDRWLEVQGASFAGAAATVAFTPVKLNSVSASGKAQVNSTLVAKVAKGSKASKITYQWLRDGRAISKANSTKYKLVNADRGKRVSLKVTATSPGQKPVVKTSSKTSKVIGTLKNPNPKVSLKGSKVKCPQWNCKAVMQAKVSKDSGAKVKYQWYRNGKAIKGATKSTHTVKYKYKKKAKHNVKYTVKATASKAGFKTVSQNSTSTTRAWVKLPK